MNAAAIGYLAVQAAQMYLEVSQNSKTMTDEEAKAAYEAVGKRVTDANEMWESAGDQG